MIQQSILIIRHAEKPVPGGDQAIDLTGAIDPRSLTPRGWQRAGAWAEFFAPSLGRAPALSAPTAVFASAPATRGDAAAQKVGSKSRRPLETVTPTAEKLGLQIDLRFAAGQEAELATAISAVDGVVLVCWQHESIIPIAKLIEPTVQNLPHEWPGDRFNVMFKFERPDRGSRWTFGQIVATLLAGDKSELI
jgi:hypothetical protein